MKPVKIADYGITEEFGYLPNYDPARSLSVGNEDWDQFGKEIPKLLMSSNFRKRVTELPDFNVKALKGDAEIQRAMLILSISVSHINGVMSHRQPRCRRSLPYLGMKSAN